MIFSDETGNIRRFICFRLFFNARFYYPVFAILFLDYGLSMSQFALLNAVWAGVIVAGEVPFGALADRMGRRPLVIAAAVLMVLEMAVLLAAPVGVPEVAFWFFLVNRILSGCAEALASGADESLAYDSLPEAGREEAWAQVLKSMMAWQSAAFFLAMLVGGAVYDAGFINAVGAALGITLQLEATTTLRLPVLLTLLTGIAALVVALRMREAPRHDAVPGAAVSVTWSELRGTLAWLSSHRVVASLIVLGLLYDSVMRMMVTLGSEYLRLIQYPEAVFGILGAITAATGWLAGITGRAMVARFSRAKNLLALGVIGVVGLIGVACAFPYWGYAFWILIMGGFGLLNFFMSSYINAETASHRRATVLSVKSLAFNLGYGAVGLLYAGYNLLLHSVHPIGDGESLFATGLPAFPIYFAATFFIGWLLLRKKLVAR